MAHSVGVSSIPEVIEINLGPNDKFAIVASDGLWEFLENEKICEIVLPFYH